MIKTLKKNKEYRVIAQTTYYLMRNSDDKKLVMSSDKKVSLRFYNSLIKKVK
jgi:hypothetical protein